jgi:serine/threonine-protein kinase HipA
VISERALYVGLAGEPGAPPVAAGVLKLARQGVMEHGQFAYGTQYLQAAGAVALNPEHLPLQAAVFALEPARVRDGGALPLTLRDALPDAWGRRVLEIQHGRELPDVDVLLATNDDRTGAMVFSEALPIDPQAGAQPPQDLDGLARAAALVEAGEDPGKAHKQLLLGGGSLGGMRPKATFIHEGVRHLAKFPSRSDDHDVEAVEAATLGLARACGIAVPEFFLYPLRQRQALLLRRFDREGPATAERRLHYLSAAAWLGVRYESSGGSYVELAQALRRHGARPQADLPELFRRLVFNLVADNSDDHVRNHGILLRPGEGWRLAPAFDLVMQLTNIGYQALAILPGRLESGVGLALEAAPHFGLSPGQARAIVQEIADTVHTQALLMLEAHGATGALQQRAVACLQKQATLIGL